LDISEGIGPTKTLGALDCVLSSICHDAAAKRISVFVLNRHLTETMDLTIELRGVAGSLHFDGGRALAGFDLAAVNSTTDEIRPSPHPAAVADAELRTRLAPASWNVFLLGYG
jgi:alpha-N-arabinofuranosidase